MYTSTSIRGCKREQHLLHLESSGGHATGWGQSSALTLLVGWQRLLKKYAPVTHKVLFFGPVQSYEYSITESWLNEK